MLTEQVNTMDFQIKVNTYFKEGNKTEINMNPLSRPS